MRTIHHHFVYVIDRPDDPFAGLRDLLSRGRRARHAMQDIRLSADNFVTVNRVEYSSKRKCRVLYYGSVFRQLAEKLRRAVERCPADEGCVFYFSDEGVWAEFWRRCRGELERLRPVSAVSVQHGHAKRVRAKHLPLRRALNLVSRTLVGFPQFGMGSLGGVGAGVFDVYLVYDEENARFVRANTGDLAYSCPSLIKRGLLRSYQQASEVAVLDGASRRTVMFALQPIYPGTGGPNSVFEVVREFVPLARSLSLSHDCRVVLRPHPGMPMEEIASACSKSGIGEYAIVEPRTDLAESLARSSVVLSHYSTVLWEAYLVGIVPVSVWGGAYRGGWEYPHERLDLTGGVEDQLHRILSPETAAKYRDSRMGEDFDWESVIADRVFKDASSLCLSQA